MVQLNVRILASTCVPFRPTTVQMPNLALIEKDYSVQVNKKDSLGNVLTLVVLQYT